MLEHDYCLGNELTSTSKVRNPLSKFADKSVKLRLPKPREHSVHRRIRCYNIRIDLAQQDFQVVLINKRKDMSELNESCSCKWFYESVINNPVDKS